MLEMIMTQVTIHNRTLQFSKEMTRYLQSCSTKTTISRVLINQVMRSACSIGANVVEAQNSATKKEFRRFLQISLRSAKETEYWLTIFKEIGGADYKKIDILLEENKQISKIIATILIKSANNHNY